MFPLDGEPGEMLPSLLSQAHTRRTRRSCSALPMTETELRLIAAAAMTGLSNTPKAGYSTPGRRRAIAPTPWVSMA